MKVIGQLVETSSFLLPQGRTPGIELEVVSLGSKHLYLLNHIDSPVSCFF